MRCSDTWILLSLCHINTLTHTYLEFKSFNCKDISTLRALMLEVRMSEIKIRVLSQLVAVVVAVHRFRLSHIPCTFAFSNRNKSWHHCSANLMECERTRCNITHIYPFRLFTQRQHPVNFRIVLFFLPSTLQLEFLVLAFLITKKISWNYKTIHSYSLRSVLIFPSTISDATIIYRKRNCHLWKWFT